MSDRMKKVMVVVLLLTGNLHLFAQKQTLNVIYIGDSITQGVQMSDPSTQSPPAIASKSLQEQPGVEQVNSSNQGHSGYTTLDFLPATETFRQVEQAANIFVGKPGFLVFSIMLGTNDSAITGPNGAPVSPDGYFTNLKTIIDQLLRDYPACKVIIHHPIWYSPNTYNGAKYLRKGLKRLKKYFPQIHKLADQYSVTNPKQVFVGDTGGFSYFKKNHASTLIPENGHKGIFYLHPNPQGALALGQFWSTAIYHDLFVN